ncbi:hypothetical protein RHGRI_026526 [Rhododendron griersonianum]|uniref:Uncharacterized protein n=1 Tax=Rhododendron griersonianum TaxID=479676 RepID=A0AAV6IWS7_9ERIC|nr:hypothetical protein RHGRI_026526 [Rhododendron griersonianum]
MEEGLGFKAIDSNEIRRKQKSISDPNGSLRLQQVISENPKSDNSLVMGFPPLITTNDPKLGSSLRQSTSTTHPAWFGSYRPKSSFSPDGFGAHSPKSAKSTTSAQKLQQAFFEEALRVEAGAAMKGSVTLSSSNGAGAHSPKSQGNTTDAQEVQQASFKDGLVREAEARARVTHLHGNTYQFQRTPSEVRNSNSNPKILYNSRGNPYVEGDPNLGYPVEDTKPRYQSGAVPNPANHASTSTNPVSQPKAMNRQVQTFFFFFG